MALRETFADVAALIPQYSWEIMDDEQRDALMRKVVLPRYMKTTADGVQLGPTAWADMVGASASAVRNRIGRLQQSHNRAPVGRARRDQQAAAKVLREASPNDIAELLDTPSVRAKVGKALDVHYSTEAQKSSERHHEREVARKGGKEEHVAFTKRQRVAELVSVVRGASSALRFAAGQARALRLNERDASIDELRGSLDEILGFTEMLIEFLDGREITDDDIAQLIGEPQ